MTKPMLRCLLFACALIVVSALPVLSQPLFQNQNLPVLLTLTAQGAGTIDSVNNVNAFNRGVIVGINISSKSGTIAVVVAIEGQDAASGQWYDICDSASLTSAGFTTLTVYPGATAAANSVCSVPLPPIWRVEVRSGTGVTPSFNGTIGAALLV